MNDPVRSTITNKLKLEKEVKEQTLETKMRIWRARSKLKIKYFNCSKRTPFEKVMAS